MRFDRPHELDCTEIPNPDAIELPSATYRTPRCSVEPIEAVVVVVVDAIDVDDADGAAARGDALSLEQPSANEPATIIHAVRETVIVIV